MSNYCENNGGAVLVDGLEAFFYSVENVTYQGNSARAGGGIASENSAVLYLNAATFSLNRSDCTRVCLDIFLTGLHLVEVHLP